MNTKLFYEILEQENIRTLFQPIVSLTTGEVYSYEALSRGPKNTMLESPIALIEKAEELNSSWELEFLFRKKAIQKSKDLGMQALLFLNVDPNIVYDKNFTGGCTKEFLLSSEKDPSKIVFEITERTVVKDKNSYLKMLDHYRSQNYKIAIDDAGAGYSGFNLIKDTKPEYIKIDMELIRDIHIDEFKQALIKSFVVLAKSTNIKTIAEGIESTYELRTLINLGVDLGQGFYLARPNENLCLIDEQIKQEICTINFDDKKSKNDNFYCDCIGSLCISSNNIGTTITCNKQNLNSLGSEYNPIDIISKKLTDTKISILSGVALYGKKKISKLMYEPPLSVDYYSPINKVKQLAMKRNSNTVYDNILITKDSKYVGNISIKDLLEYSATTG